MIAPNRSVQQTLPLFVPGTQRNIPRPGLRSGALQRGIFCPLNYRATPKATVMKWHLRAARSDATLKGAATNSPPSASTPKSPLPFSLTRFSLVRPIAAIYDAAP